MYVYMCLCVYVCVYTYTPMLCRKQPQSQCFVLYLELGSFSYLRPPFSYCGSHSPITVIKYPGKGNLMGKGLVLAVCSRVQAFMAGKLWWRGREETGHSASAGRKQRSVDASTQLAFSFICNPEPNVKEWYCPPLGQAFPLG